MLLRVGVLFALILSGCSSDQAGGTAGPDGSAAAGGSGAKDGGGTGATSGTGAAAGTGGAKDASTDTNASCAGVTCSGHGTCTAAGGNAACNCDKGYHANGLACEADQSCAGVDCGLCGTCQLQNGVATCTCPTGYELQGGKCVLNPDPCATTTCGADQACVSEAHCQPLGACVQTCDCSNCGNCGPDNSDGRWNDMQEYCGNLNNSPATMACTKPCPAGEGCIPYSPAICWPMEGCLSL